MQLEKLSPTKYRITLHAYELASIISAARWVGEGAKGELSAEAIEQMRSIVENYDAVSKNLQNN